VPPSQARNAHGRPTADPGFCSEDIAEQVGRSACHEMDVVEIGRRDHEVQRSDDRSHAIQIAERETHARDGVHPGLAGSGVPLLDRQILA